MKKKLLSGLLVLVFMFTVLVVPITTFAQPYIPIDADTKCSGVNDLVSRLICKVGAVVNAVIPILIALGVVFFIWGVISYAIAKDEEAKTKGRGAMINGIIALAVIVSLWGLVNLLKNFAGIQGYNQTIEVPCIGVGCPE